VGRAVVVGAGPAGASLAFLLAERGVDVLLVERQRDFAREFRGEILLPSGIAALEEMGLGRVLDAVPQARPPELEVFFGGRRVVHASLANGLLGARAPAALSQPALLEAIVAEASRRSSFELLRGAAVRGLLAEAGRVVGVRVEGSDGVRALRADLVVGADGRASAVRRRGGFEAVAQDVPMDVVWCKLPSLDALRGARAYVGRGHLLIAYRSWDGRTQVAWAIVKGTFGALRRQGSERWLDDMAAHVSPDLAEHLRASREDVRHPFLLDCVADRATRWSAPGVLLVGDAAHTMSPVGGQGLNLALRDAVVAANELVPALRRGAPEGIDAAAARVEAARLPEVRAIQRLQALPPRLVLARSAWGELARRLLAALLRSGLGRRRALEAIRPFLVGLGEVRLRV
jgi:2-polyprenyl-6-methoxyphenol hydroxylase-like FAD-dependent oxidoreductase